MRWRLYIEEYPPELIYLKGADNEAADAMSRLPLTQVNKDNNDKKDSDENPAIALNTCRTNEVTEKEQYSINFCSEHFNMEEDPDWNPVTYSNLETEQKPNNLLKKLLKIDKCQLSKSFFHGGGKKYSLWTLKEKIYVPVSLQK